jgi:hypothetical protein
MLIIRSKNDVPIRLTLERWGHITSRHLEMDGQKEMVLETVSEPDMIQEGDFGELIAIRFYRSTPLTSKYLAVIYKESSSIDGFVVTAYFTSKTSERRNVIWER